MDAIKLYEYKVINNVYKDAPNYVGKRLSDRVQDSYTGSIKGIEEPVFRPAGSWKLRRGTIKLLNLSKQYPEFGYLLACSMLPWGATLASARKIFHVAGINKLISKIKMEENK